MFRQKRTVTTLNQFDLEKEFKKQIENEQQKQNEQTSSETETTETSNSSEKEDIDLSQFKLQKSKTSQILNEINEEGNQTNEYVSQIDIQKRIDEITEEFKQSNNTNKSNESPMVNQHVHSRSQSLSSDKRSSMKSKRQTTPFSEIEHKPYLSPLAIKELLTKYKQFNCVKIKGKKKESAICIIDEDTLHVLFRIEGSWEVENEIKIKTIQKIRKNPNVPGQIKIVFGKEENTQHIYLILNNHLEKFLNELASKGQ